MPIGKVYNFVYKQNGLIVYKQSSHIVLDLLLQV